MRKSMLTAVLVIGLVLGMASAGAASDITLGFVEWDCAFSQTHIVAAVLEEHFDMDVELTSVEAGVMWLGIAQGDLDAILAAWLPHTHGFYWEEYGDRVVKAGVNFEGARIGLVVPEYVEADSIADLNDYTSEFNGMIYGIDPGAGIMAATDDALVEYELNYNVLESSDAGMSMQLGSFIENEEWIIVTGWVPHWKFGLWDLKFLEDPKGVYGDEETVHTILRDGFADDHSEEVVQFMENFYLTSEQLAVMMNMIREGDADDMELARQWIEDHDDLVQEWLK